ncbi:hypothetical protein DFJ74DRAFT_653553 [Hyaloraphidium curvatum]|nr:hypothetical protein DFJ74DRAFT_653553 [Hyaloraphidium curvatum]
MTRGPAFFYRCAAFARSVAPRSAPRGPATAPPSLYFPRGSRPQHSAANSIRAAVAAEMAEKEKAGLPEVKSTIKRDTLRAIERRIQALWAEERVFEIDAPAAGEERPPKFMATFPYPYMNGKLHLGHSFSLSKVEFAVSYERMKGKKSLFPFGFHCTGMPIKASADKIKRELEMFGPEFKVPEDRDDADATANGPAAPKKSKVLAKTGNVQYQFQIMLSMGVPLEEIPKFADPTHWLYYFPPLAIEDLKALGIKNDWRRSFITTDANPYYDSFIRWQFNKLNALEPKKVKFGERYTIYSPLDGQPCMDHDRQSGEGVGVQEYTGIKIRVLNEDLFTMGAEGGFQVKGKKVGEKLAKEMLEGSMGRDAKVYLVAATLRPETMYGQTNCYVGPDITYGVYKAHAADRDEYWIVTERAARNMAYQSLFGRDRARGEVEKVLELTGWDLVGVPIKAPLTKYEKVYVVPMEGVLSTKGTGVVTSVPSDSPDDFITLTDLVKKPAYYNVDPSWVEPFLPPIEIIDTPEYGTLAAVKACEIFKIKSPKDKLQLTQAKEAVYKVGFYGGTMLIGKYKGKPVQDAKPLIKDDMVASGEAIVYCEPENLVMSRSGDECVAALVDQWYLDYGEQSWKDLARKCLDRLNTYGEETRNQFVSVLGWLHEWACSRSFGLGSRLPWDKEWLIESLSDSTIYMAYYTVSHLLHQGTLDGSKPGPLGITPEQMTDEVWEYILIDSAPFPSSSDIPKEKLETLRNEFQYWYPMDLRCSGKDLIPNHLTFAIYNHVAIFPEEKWPKAIRSNGHLLLNAEKMSKSTGNFMTLEDAVEEFGADATRVALADAGDFSDDANFQVANANAAILRLFTQKEWVEQALQEIAEGKLRTGPYNFNDRVFEAEMNRFAEAAAKAYDGMMYKEALKNGLYEFQAAKDWYRDYNLSVSSAMSRDDAAVGLHKDLVERFIEWQTLLLTPIAPHWSEYIWREVLKKPSTVLDQPLPKPQPNDESVMAAANYLRSLLGEIRSAESLAARKAAKKGGQAEATKGPRKGKLYLAKSFPAWQDKVLEELRKEYDESTNTFKRDIKEILAKAGLMKEKLAFPFAMETRSKTETAGVAALDRTLKFDERKTVEDNMDYICKQLNLVSLDVVEVDGPVDGLSADEKRIVDKAVPGLPGFIASA